MSRLLWALQLCWMTERGPVVRLVVEIPRGPKCWKKALLDFYFLNINNKIYKHTSFYDYNDQHCIQEKYWNHYKKNENYEIKQIKQMFLKQKDCSNLKM